MEVDISKRNKKQILDNIKAVVDEFNEREDINTVFGKPKVAFVSTTHPLFDTFFARGENDHPKKLYRPGNTLIVHYVPWEGDVAKGNEAPGRPSEEWLAADRESLWLAMEINKTIKKTLDKVGRLHSNTSTMIDWDKDRHRYGWSNKIAAFIGGIGSFGPAGSLHVEGSYGGRSGSIITAALYAEDRDPVAAERPETDSDPGAASADPNEPLDSDALEEIFENVMKDCRFEGFGGECDEEMISACPGKAITSEGIDREKCQDWCITIDRHTPSPDVCGKCFRFK